MIESKTNKNLDLMIDNKSNKITNKVYSALDILILLFLIICLFLFVIYPVYSVIKSSFLIDGKITFDVYNNLFKNNSRLFLNSIHVATLTTIISTSISIIVSIHITFSGGKIRKALLLLLMLTMISPPFVSSLSYITLFGRRGLITHRLLGLTLSTYGWQGIVSMQSLSSASLSSMLLVGTINGINKDIINSSLDLGATTSYTIRKIILPLMKPGIMAVALLTFVRSLSDFGTPIIIGGSFNVLATQAYFNVIAYSNMPLASAISVLIFIPAIIIFYAYRMMLDDREQFSQTNVSNDIFTENIKVSGALWRTIQIIAGLFLLAMALQYMSIFLSAITKYKAGKMYFTMEHIKNLKRFVGSSLFRSIRYAFIAGIVGSMLGFLMSYYVEIRKVPGSRILDFISTIPSIVPGVFFGIGYILAFNDKPLALTGTSAIVILNILFRLLPANTKNSNAVIAQIDSQVEEAGKDLGAHNIFILKDIILPMTKPAFAVNFINNFKFTMTTIGSIIFLIYPGKKLATFEMFEAIQGAQYNLGAAIACAIIIITLLVSVGSSKLIMRWEDVR